MYRHETSELLKNRRGLNSFTATQMTPTHTHTHTSTTKPPAAHPPPQTCSKLSHTQHTQCAIVLK